MSHGTRMAHFYSITWWRGKRHYLVTWYNELNMRQEISISLLYHVVKMDTLQFGHVTRKDWHLQVGHLLKNINIGHVISMVTWWETYLVLIYHVMETERWCDKQEKIFQAVCISTSWSSDKKQRLLTERICDGHHLGYARSRDVSHVGWLEQYNRFTRELVAQIEEFCRSVI